MLNKIFLGVFAVALIATSVFFYLTYSSLGSIGFSAPVIVQNFESYLGISQIIFWVCSALLLIISNILLWSNRSAWALWLSFLYFAVFMLFQTLWLNDGLRRFKNTNGLGDGSFTLLPFAGALLCVAVAVGVFFNQFVVFRMRDKMIGAKAAEKAIPEEAETKETED